jgi:lysozyme family protein
MNRIIAALTGKTHAGYIITTRVYKGRELQSGPSYNTRELAAEQFIARGFANDKTAKIVALWV